jgi:hypothetical protein
MSEVSDEGRGWILKAPYVQNARGFPIRNVYCAANLEEVLHRICKVPTRNVNKINIKASDVFDYLILQPRMKNNNESKIILYNGKAQYFSSVPRRGLTGKFGEEELLKFAEEAWNELQKQSAGAFLGDGLTRVDLFSKMDGMLVVNEFENLDASYSKLGGTFETNTKMFLVEYYYHLTNTLLSKL